MTGNRLKITQIFQHPLLQTERGDMFMPFCIDCGQELIEGANFCANCGKAVSMEVSKRQREYVYEGKLHKCPNCGDVINSFESNCSTCGYEIRDAHGISSVSQLAMRLEQLEAQRPPQKGKRVFNGRVRLQSIDEQKINLIKNFHIPNAKEDVFEFIVLAASNIDLKVYGLDSSRYQMFDPARRELSDAWLAKLEQADNKAEIMFGHTQEYLSIQNIYENKLKAIKREKNKIVWLLVGIFGSYFLLAGFVLMILALTGAL